MRETWLRIVTYRIEDVTAIQHVRAGLDQVLQMLACRPGFREGNWGHNDDAGTVAAVTYWSDRAAIEAAADDLGRLNLDRTLHGARRTGAINLRLLGGPRPGYAPMPPGLAAGASTWLRIVRYRPQPHARADAAEYLRSTTDTVLRVLRHQEGFRAGYWGHDPETGTMGAVTYWDTPDAIAATGSLFERLHRERHSHGITTEHVANLELFGAPRTLDPCPSTSQKPTAC